MKCSNAIVTEMQCLREETGRQLRDNTRALKDVKSELVNLCEDMMRQLKSLVVTMKASKVFISSIFYRTTFSKRYYC